jgi:hypothetical protein
VSITYCMIWILSCLHVPFYISIGG